MKDPAIMLGVDVELSISKLWELMFKSSILKKL
jgi:hypothetical protein